MPGSCASACLCGMRDALHRQVRLLQEKDQRAAKLEQTNLMCEEMMSNARHRERESLAKAAAAEKAAEEATQRTRQWRSGPAGLLDRMSSLGSRAAQVLG